MANIHRNILLNEMETFARGLSPKGGHLLLSGFFSEDVQTIMESTVSRGFRIVDQGKNEDWALVHLILPEQLR
jgi:ribosomal protein L11 methyltransferase